MKTRCLKVKNILLFLPAKVQDNLRVIENLP
jgi:hypothetical protein